MINWPLVWRTTVPNNSLGPFNAWSTPKPIVDGKYFGYEYVISNPLTNNPEITGIKIYEKPGTGWNKTWNHIKTLDVRNDNRNTHDIISDYYSNRNSPPVAADPFAAYTPPNLPDTGDDTFSLGEEGYKSPSGPYSLIKPGRENSPGYNQELSDDWIKNQQEAMHARLAGRVETTNMAGKKTYELPGNNYDTPSLSLMPPGTGNSVSGVPLQLGRGGKSKRKRRRNKKTRRNSRRKTKRRR